MIIITLLRLTSSLLPDAMPQSSEPADACTGRQRTLHKLAKDGHHQEGHVAVPKAVGHGVACHRCSECAGSHQCAGPLAQALRPAVPSCGCQPCLPRPGAAAAGSSSLLAAHVRWTCAEAAAHAGPVLGTEAVPLEGAICCHPQPQQQQQQSQMDRLSCSWLPCRLPCTFACVPQLLCCCCPQQRGACTSTSALSASPCESSSLGNSSAA